MSPPPEFLLAVRSKNLVGPVRLRFAQKSEFSTTPRLKVRYTPHQLVQPPQPTPRPRPRRVESNYRAFNSATERRRLQVVGHSFRHFCTFMQQPRASPRKSCPPLPGWAPFNRMEDRRRARPLRVA